MCLDNFLFKKGAFLSLLSDKTPFMKGLELSRLNLLQAEIWHATSHPGSTVLILLNFSKIGLPGF